MSDDDNRGALEQLRAALFGARPPTTADAAPRLVAAGEGSNPPAALTASAVFRDWGLRVIDANQYRALNPTPLADLVGRD